MDISSFNLLIVEENNDQYTATRELIERFSGEQCTIRRAHTFSQATTLLANPDWDVALVTDTIEKQPGLLLVRQARDQGNVLPIIVITDREEKKRTTEIIKAGATDYCIRSEITTPLLERIIRHAREQYQSTAALDEARALIASNIQEHSSTISRIQRELAAQVEQQFAIAQLGQIALSASSLDDIFNEAVDLTAQILQVPYVAVLEKEGDTLLLFQSEIGWSRASASPQRIPIHTSTHAGYTLQHNIPVAIHNVQRDTRITDEGLVARGIISGICIPIQGSGGPWGAFCVHSTKRRRFTDEEVSFLQSVTTVIALSIERNRMEEVNRYQGSHDPVTGIANRLLLEEKLEVELARAKRTQSGIGILFLDLDNFKYINDTLGHPAGDLVLKEVSVRLQNNIRKNALLARFGGDEFVIVTPDIGSIRSLEKQVEEIFKALHKPFMLHGQEFTITTSIGMATFPQDGDTVDTLMKNADIALYHAKDTRSNSYQAYFETMSSANSARVKLESELRKAVELQEFELRYEPMVDIKQNIVVAAEALLRWNHPVLGLLSPVDFLPLAEELGLIVPLGTWVFHTVAQDIATWRRAGIPLVPVSVNLSAQQFEQDDLVSQIETAAKKAEINPRFIEIEVTETMAMQNIQMTIDRLQALADLGFSAILDDFGTGHSSLNYLKQLPVQKLKIDQSFMKDCVNNKHDAAIVRAIISLAHSLKLLVVAEGVEDKEQLAFLLSLNCDLAQGFLFSSPRTSEDFMRFLRKPKKK